jgi:dolichyl-phosphate beta-glucosyltransferase
MGRGAAVQAGVLHARGSVIVAVDGDVNLNDLRRIDFLNCENLNGGKSVVVIGGAPIPTTDSFLNDIQVFLSVGIVDAQPHIIACSRDAARWIFPNMHMQHWGYTWELYLLARERGIPVSRFPSSASPQKMTLIPIMRTSVEFMQTYVFHRLGLWRARYPGEF